MGVHRITHFTDIPGATRQRKKQWVILTSGILSKDKERSQQVSDNTLAGFVDAVETTLAQVFGFSFQSKDMLALKTVIGPYMPAIFALHLQEADYVLSMLPAAAVKNEELEPQIFNADMMEDSSGEDEGFLQASYFPLVCKENIKDGGTVSCISGICWIIILTSTGRTGHRLQSEGQDRYLKIHFVDRGMSMEPRSSFAAFMGTEVCILDYSRKRTAPSEA